MRRKRQLASVGLLLIVCVVASADGQPQGVVNGQEGSTASVPVQNSSTASHASAQQYDQGPYGVEEPGTHRYSNHGHTRRTPGEQPRAQKRPYVFDQHDSSSRDDSYLSVGYQPADPVGQTHMMFTARRTLARPASTTLRQLAGPPPPPDYSAEPYAAQQQHALPQGVHARQVRPFGTRRPAPVPTDKVQGKLTAPGAPQGPAAAAAANYYDADATSGQSFDGLTAFDQAFANGGNQKPEEPAEPGLCVGQGFVLATAKSVLQVYDAATGDPLVAPLDHNTFYGFPAQFNATTKASGPVTYYPSCVFDQDTRRWFHVVLTLAADIEGVPTRPPTLDIAVSDGPDPTGSWTYFNISTANNGNDGTPDADCEGGFCIAEFPRIAAWKHALIVAANEAPAAAPGVSFAVVYAIDKSALTSGAAQTNTALVRTEDEESDVILNTLIPAIQEGDCSIRNTFLVSTPAPRRDGDSLDSLQLFSLRGTETLRSQQARVVLNWVSRDVALDISYSIPPLATQKPGDIPYGTVTFNITTVSKLDTMDARMASVSFVDDKLYCAWGSAVQAVNQTVAGAAWALIDPVMPDAAVDSGLLRATRGNHLLYPSLAVRPGGLGVMAFTVSGPEHYPTAAFAILTEDGLGQLTNVAEGFGPIDGFTGYGRDRVNAFGPYAAAVVDEHGDFWLASEYAGQTCTVEEYKQPVGSPLQYTCNKARSRMTNWYTAITQVVLGDYGTYHDST